MDGPALTPPPAAPPPWADPSAAPRGRRRGVGRAAKGTLIFAGILALLGAGSCAIAFSSTGDSAFGPGILGLFLLIAAAVVGFVGLILTTVAVATRNPPLDPATGEPMPLAVSTARGLTIGTAALIGVDGALSLASALVPVGVLPVRIAAGGLFGIFGDPLTLLALAGLILAIIIVSISEQERLSRGMGIAAMIYIALRIIGLLGFVLAGIVPLGLIFGALELGVAGYLLSQLGRLSATPTPPP